MSTVNTPQAAVLSFGMGIAIGLSVMTFMSIGISNAKKKKGGNYGMQVIGLLLSLAWTLYFVWKMAKASGAAQMIQAQGARMSAKIMGRSGASPATNVGTSAVA